jgi:hypothetical protein
MGYKSNKQSTKVSLAHFFRFSSIIIVLILLSLFIVNEILTSLEIKYTYYDTYEDMVKDGAIKRGWFPADFPLSASNIHVQYNLDSNTLWTLFNASISDIDDFKEHFESFKFENYKGVNLLAPKDGYLFKNYKSIDRDLVTNVFKGIKIRDFNKYYNSETEVYIAELSNKKNIPTFYYWTNGTNLIPKN